MHDDDDRFVLDQHSELEFYSTSSLKQKSTGRHVAPLRHINLILRQPAFALSPYCCVLSGEAKNTNFVVFGLTPSGLEPICTIYHTRGRHAYHYTIDVLKGEFAVAPATKICGRSLSAKIPVDMNSIFMKLYVT